MDNKEVLQNGIHIVLEKIASSEDDATFKITVRWYDDDKKKTFDIHYMYLNVAFDSNGRLTTTKEEILEIKKYFFGRAVFHGYLLKAKNPKAKLCEAIMELIEAEIQKL